MKFRLRNTKDPENDYLESVNDFGIPEAADMNEAIIQLVRYTIGCMDDIIADLDYHPANRDDANTRQTKALLLEGNITQNEALRLTKEWYYKHDLVVTFH
jgi:hypothetical protein